MLSVSLFETTIIGTWSECLADKVIALPLWSNIRFFNLNSRLTVMDTVGNSQFEVMDVEAIFPDDYSPHDVQP